MSQVDLDARPSLTPTPDVVAWRDQIEIHAITRTPVVGTPDVVAYPDLHWFPSAAVVLPTIEGVFSVTLDNVTFTATGTITVPATGGRFTPSSRGSRYRSRQFVPRSS